MTFNDARDVRPRRMRAEWEPQDAVIIAWPHVDTDWAPDLPSVNVCYVALATKIAERERLIILTPYPDDIPDEVKVLDQVTVCRMATNDTWTRDYGPLSVDIEGMPVLLDFTFNAWGMKFAADRDNLVNSRLAQTGMFAAPMENHRDMVLEGGSVDTDGHGTVITTTACLLSDNRNPHMSKARIEQELLQRLGARKVLWLDHGTIPGDDTDCHIDTLARFANPETIVYATANPGDDNYEEMLAMERQLRTFSDADNRPYRLVPLPAAETLLDTEGEPMPATYANFLVTNHLLLVPTYGNSLADRQAIETLARLYPDRKVAGIDCRPLIAQHGSLHCATMQLAQGTLK